MSKALETVLGFVPLTEALRTQMSGIPDLFPAEFFQTNPANKVLGDRAKFVRISGQRRTSIFGAYGSPAIRHNLLDVGESPARCLHSFESFPIDMTVLQKLRSFEQYQQDEGMDWLRYQFEEAAKRHKNSEIVALASTLRQGVIYFDSGYNLLPTSSGADTTKNVSFNVPATHQNQINGVIDFPWSLPNTDIPGHIRGIQQNSREETGLEQTCALYGKNIPRYMTTNDGVQPYLSRSGDARDKFLMTGEIPSGLFGIKDWIPVYQSFYENTSGTNTLLWDDDLVVFVPNVGQPDKMSWYKKFEGSMPVPKTLDVQRDPMAAINSFEIVYGPFSFAAITMSPPQIEVYHGNTWLPGLANEKAIYQAEVVF